VICSHGNGECLSASQCFEPDAAETCHLAVVEEAYPNGVDADAIGQHVIAEWIVTEDKNGTCLVQFAECQMIYKINDLLQLVALTVLQGTQMCDTSPSRVLAKGVGCHLDEPR
jgi:hypothetical protein